MKIIIVAAILSGYSLSLFAQNDVQVDPLTGRAIYGIPIGQVSVGSISAPIAMAYDGGGVQVDASDGSGGVGWNLVAGGSITRILRGLPDDYNVSGDPRKGWLNSPSRTALSSYSPTSNSGCTDWATFSGDGFDNVNNDTEPDLFVFNAPGLSGKFVYDNNGNIQLMPYQDVKITGDFSSGFTITTNQGIVYNFGTLQSTNYEAGPPDLTSLPDRRYNQFKPVSGLGVISCISVFYLSAITGTGGEQIYFNYTAGAVESSLDNARLVNSSFTAVQTNYYVYNWSIPYNLTSIVTSFGVNSATISWAGNTVSKISLTQQGIVHNFTLGYDVVKNASEDNIKNGASGVRNYLTTITEDSNCNPFPSYTFEYYHPELLPYKAEYPRDFFGYFNGASGDSLLLPIPSIYQNNSASNGEIFRIYDKPGSGYTAVTSSTTRNVNPDYIHYGSLKKINYPSGGYCQITYEPNKYYDAANASDAYGAGVRVASIEMSDGDADNSNNIVRNYEYKKADGTSSGHWTYNPSFAFIFKGYTVTGGGTTFTHPDEIWISPVNLAPEQEILYDRSTVIYPGNGKTVSEFLVPFDTATGVAGSPTPVWSVLQILGTCVGAGTDPAPSGNYIFPFAPNGVSDFSQGMISKVKHYSQGGTLLKEQNYSYQTLGSSPVAIRGMKLEGRSFAQRGILYYYGQYTMQANTGMTIQTESVTTYDMLTTSHGLTTSTGYTYNANNLLSEIAVTNSDGKVSKVKNIYANDYTFTSPTETNAIMIKKLRDLNMHGTVVESVNTTGIDVMGASLNLFDDFGTSHVFPAKQLKYVGNGTFHDFTQLSSSTALAYDTAYVLQNTVEKYNAVGLPLSTSGLDRSVSAVIYCADKTMPIATVSGARGTEIVFSDFENGENYQMASGNSTTPWTGTSSYLLTVGSNISKASVTKTAAANYRFRCRANATGAGSLKIELSNTSSGWNSTTINYGSSGQWVLLDAMIPMGSVANSFTLKLTAQTSNVIIDDVAFYPETASLQSMTYTPFAGKTSMTDNRGNSVLYAYDAHGRLMVVRNNDRNVVQWHDYKYKSEPAPAIHCGFSGSTGGSLLTGAGISLTADPIECASDITYLWKVNGVTMGTASTLQYTFTEAQDYTISLTINAMIGSSTVSGSASANYLIRPVPFAATVSGDQQAFDCTNQSDDGGRTLIAGAIGLGSEGNLTYQWAASTTPGTVVNGVMTSGFFVDLPGKTGSTYSFDCHGLSQTTYYTCKVNRNYANPVAITVYIPAEGCIR